MKATLDERGVLRVMPETKLEEYALSQWSQTNDIRNVRIAVGAGASVSRRTRRREKPQLPVLTTT